MLGYEDYCETESAKKLAQFGVAILATFAFDPARSQDPVSELHDVARRFGFDPNDRTAARTLCTQNGVMSSDFGDDVPGLSFKNRGEADADDVQASYEAWVDSRAREDADGVQADSVALIETLMAYAGIREVAQ